MRTLGYFDLNNFGNGFIKYLNAFIFLFVISISSLVLPSILPMTTFIGILLLIGGGILNLSPELGLVQKHNKIDFLENINYSNILTPIIGMSLLFFLFLFKSFGASFNFISSFASLVLHVLFLVFIINTRDFLLVYLKSYIYFVFIMALSALFGFTLLNLGIVDAQSNFVNISELTGGAFGRDGGSENSYIFPFKTGFILTGSGKLNLLGLSNYRISGWAHEPTSATLFIAPAMILLLHAKIIVNNLLRISLLTIISTFWFFTMSLGSFLAFSIFYFFYITSTLFIKEFPLKLSISIIFSILLVIVLSLYKLEDLLNSSLISSKLNFDSHTFQAALKRITFFIPGVTEGQSFAFNNTIILLIMFIFFVNVIKSLLIEQNFNPYALVVFYILIHTMKGSQDSVYINIFPFFWFYVLYFSLPNKFTKSVKS